MKRPVLPVVLRMQLPVDKDFYIFDVEIIGEGVNVVLRLDLRPYEEDGEDFSMHLSRGALEKITGKMSFEEFKAQCLNKLLLLKRKDEFSGTLALSRLHEDPFDADREID